MTDFRYEERSDITRPERLSDKHRSYIHGVARMEKALLHVQIGDRIEAETQFGPGILGDVKSVRRGWPHEGNHVVLLVPDDDTEQQDVVLDYESAFISYFPYYLSYVVAGSETESYGDVNALWINGEKVSEL